MKLGIILETKELEKAWNALRLANTAIKRGHETRVFLMGEAVECLVIDDPRFAIQAELRKLEDAHATMLACGTCLKSRNQDATESCPVSTMHDCLEMVEWADKTVTF